MQKRRHRGSRGRGYSFFHSGNAKKTGVNFLSVLAIIGLSVVLGFLTTKYVVYPLLLGEEASFDVVLGKIGIHTEEKREKNGEAAGKEADSADSQETAGAENAGIKAADTDEKVKEEALSSADSDKESFEGYAIQFGSFSTEQAANTLLQELSASGIHTSILKKDGMFKVIGQLFPDAESAAAEKAKVDAACGERYSDAFVAKTGSSE